MRKQKYVFCSFRLSHNFSKSKKRKGICLPQQIHIRLENMCFSLLTMRLLWCLVNEKGHQGEVDSNLQNTRMLISNISICKYTYKDRCTRLNEISDIYTNIAKGTTDPRVEFISQVQHKSQSNFIFRILTKHQLQNINQTSASP